jgi:hypothetical protein
MSDKHQTHPKATLNGVTADSAAWISKSVHHKGAAAGMMYDSLVFGLASFSIMKKWFLLVWNFSSSFSCFPVRMVDRDLCQFGA